MNECWSHVRLLVSLKSVYLVSIHTKQTEDLFKFLSTLFELFFSVDLVVTVYRRSNCFVQ